MELIPVARGPEYLEVHPSALKQHKELGWRECEKREQPAEGEQIDAAEPTKRRGRPPRAEQPAEGEQA